MINFIISAKERYPGEWYFKYTTPSYMLEKELEFFNTINILCHCLAEKTNSNYTFFILNSTEPKNSMTFGRGKSVGGVEELRKIARFKSVQTSGCDAWGLC